ncbi:MAG: RNA 2'-phosphotransferase [Planctomycetaceae bacterium]|nr:RNA 2'-phosphotransferase [Planctomycetaceae bacterium]
MKSLTSISKFLSLVLRHQPKVVGMQLKSEGWLPIDELIVNANRCGTPLTLELLHEVVWPHARFHFENLKRFAMILWDGSQLVPCDEQPLLCDAMASLVGCEQRLEQTQTAAPSQPALISSQPLGA